MSRSTSASVIYTTRSADTLTPGDRVTVAISLTVPKGATVTPPDPSQGFGPMAVKDWTFNRIEHSSADSLSYHYLVTNYIPGLCTIPALPYLVFAAGDTDTLYSQPLLFGVQSVLTGDTVALKELKPWFAAGTAPRWWLLLVALLIIVLALVGIKRLIHPKAKVAPPPPPPPPPYEEALAAIAALEAKKLLQQGLFREFAFELSDIFKRYIERRFGIFAAEFTTEEMLSWMRSADIGREERRAGLWFFEATDPVKFARLVPDRDTADKFLAETRLFLEKTKPVAEAEAPKTSEKKDTDEA